MHAQKDIQEVSFHLNFEEGEVLNNKRYRNISPHGGMSHTHSRSWQVLAKED